MKTLLASSVITFALIGSINAQACGPYHDHAKCSEQDEPCCSAYGQCGISPMHCEWSGRYQNPNQTAGSCLNTPCSSKSDCCDQNTGNCVWNPDGRADDSNLCMEGGNYNKKEYELSSYKQTTTKPTSSPQPTTSATTKPTSSPQPTTTTATTKPTSSPKPTTTTATTVPTSSPNQTTSATMKPTSNATTTPTSSPKPTSDMTTTPTSSPKPTSNVTTTPTSSPKPTSNMTKKPSSKPCKNPPCHKKKCIYGNCSLYEDDDEYSPAAFADPGMAILLATICVAAAFTI